MTAAGPATSTVLSPCLIRARLSSQGQVVRQGLAESPPERWRRAIVPEPTDMRGRLHHVCFHYTSLQHLFDVAELAKEAGIAIEHGPASAGRRFSTCWSRGAIVSNSWEIPAT